MSDMEFYLQVLHFSDITTEQRAELKANECTYVRRLNLWLFEGDWEFTFPQNNVTHVGEVILRSIPSYYVKQLTESVAAQLLIHPQCTFTPNRIKEPQSNE